MYVLNDWSTRDYIVLGSKGLEYIQLFYLHLDEIKWY